MVCKLSVLLAVFISLVLGQRIFAHEFYASVFHMHKSSELVSVQLRIFKNDLEKSIKHPKGFNWFNIDVINNSDTQNIISDYITKKISLFSAEHKLNLD